MEQLPSASEVDEAAGETLVAELDSVSVPRPAFGLGLRVELSKKVGPELGTWLDDGETQRRIIAIKMDIVKQ